ncbi:MAG: DNA-directed RNA polymerase subunit beta' [Clostridiales bacterium]|nr:DNA-directed RNA polymerase subunit beta' [Clostridiales bacterium]MBQ3047007.1 DNA-directed RNA polymerase subunit beta' [Clostridia bacterium]
MFELNNFDSIQIGVASPEKIREWSYGEVTKPETINYRTQKPEMGGLFCERIFGPTKDWECHCGKYKRIRYKGVICDKCGVEITKSKVRRDRMGHIELAAPVSHIWYFKGVPSRIGLMLDMSPKSLEQVLYFACHVVLEPGATDLAYKQVINDREKLEYEEKYGIGSFKTGMGAEAIKELLMAVDLDKESAETKKIIEDNASGQRRIRAVKRIEIIEAFRKSGNRPEWMILDVLPVIPPELRPMVQLDGGRFATSDLNDLYRRVINRNNRLKKLMELGAPEIIIRNEKRMLQEAVDALIDNGRRGKAISGAGNRELKSLSGMLRGKQGRFRQNLLGKRVDYSGRSVIVVGPELKLYQCGLPKEMAIELFKPFVMKKLVENNVCHNIKNAKRTVERGKAVVWDVLEEVIKDHPVMLNRAPTLHRLSIQAFEPVLIEGRAIKLHPLVCGAFNADFDGDQMAVHVPLSVEAQAEARFLMLASNNILKLSDGKPVMSPSQDMVMGAYYLTIIRRKIGEKYNEKGRKDENGKVYGVPEHTVSYTSPEEAIMAYQTGKIRLQDEIVVRREVEVDGEKVTGRVKTSVGKIIFNEAIPQNLGFTKRETKEDYLKYEIDKLTGKKDLQKIVGACFKRHGASCAADVLDKVKALGFKYSTIGAITTSVFDMHMPKDKAAILKEAEEHVLKVENLYKKGYITDEERYKKVVSIWKQATDDITDKLMDTLDEFNPILMMANSGARGSKDQIKQLAGMRGLMTDPNGKTIEIPVKSCFREGLSVLEYFISSHGGRKGLADTALKTADSGYLTRRLVDVSQEVIIKEDDCFAESGDAIKGIKVRAITGSKGEEIEGLRDRIAGRFTVTDVINPTTGEIMVKANEMITEDMADEIVKAGIEEVEIRSIFTCKSKTGVCAKCYGKNMSNNNPVQIGEAVGIIAAQSIGEPGTQLTMRTFHTGGIASTGDITQGLPRVEELFEARKPKHAAIVCEHSGEVEIEEKDKIIHVIVKTDEGENKDYTIPFGTGVIVKTGDKVEPGSVLTNGSVYPQDILKTKGIKGVQDYILKEIQSVYRSQGVDINDKHVEIIVRQMMKKVQVENPGGTDILPGEKLDVHKFEEETLNALENGLMPPQGKRILLGITKAALAKDSFLSAASFQETARVLTEAAIKNKIDPLIGLKENVIIGKLIPAGTGIKNYKNVAPQTVLQRPTEVNE